MSQQNLSTTAASFNYPLDLFATLTVSSSLATAAGSSSGTTATVDTASPHGLQTGDTATITGCTPSGYNGTYVVTRVDADTISYTTAGSNIGAISVQGNVNTLPAVKAGELVTAAGGGKARVSGQGATAGTLRLKAVKGAASTWSGALTFGTSGVSGLSYSNIEFKNELSRTDSSDGTKKTVTEYTYGLTDSGFELDTTARLTARGSAPKQVVSAVRFGASKAQANDTSTAPTKTATAFTVINGKTSKAATQTISKSALGKIRIVVSFDEAVAVTVGATPAKYALVFAAGGGTVNADAVYNATASDTKKMVFEYTMTGLENDGAMVSATYTAGTTTVADISGGAVTMTGIDPTVTSWTVGA